MAAAAAAAAGGSAALSVLRPPAAFGIVERNVYRSGLVEEASFSFVQQLNLSSALVLCVEAPSKLLREFFDDSGVKVAHLGLAKWRARPSWRPVNEELVKEALEFVLDPRNHPVLIMCTSGVHETGAVVGCLRRLQSWCLTSILEEYQRYAGERARQSDEQFIELFDTDLIRIPSTLPSWFEQQLEELKTERRFEAELAALGPLEPEDAERIAAELPPDRRFHLLALSGAVISSRVVFDAKKSIPPVDE